MILMFPIFCVKDSLEDQPQAEGTFLLKKNKKKLKKKLKKWSDGHSPKQAPFVRLYVCSIYLHLNNQTN